MRSVPKGSFERFSSLEGLWAAWLRCRQGKRRQPRIAAFDLDADRHLCRLHRELHRGTYRPSSMRLKVVHEPKTRLVAAPEIIDRVVHNALLGDIGPTFERGFIDQSYACCTGRGPHRAVLAYLEHMRRHRFRMGLDVRRYFASVHLETLHQLFARRLRDPRTVALIAELLAAGSQVYRSPLAFKTLKLDRDPLPAGHGLPLGGYLSHWSGGLYLDGLDHFIKRTLKIRAYQRYMDDLSLFDDDPDRLVEVRGAIGEWLRVERRLELKPRRDGAQPNSQPATYLGYRISRAGVLPGSKPKRRLRRSLCRAEALGDERLIRTLRSYRGLLLAM